jgi:PiT family inorganic phosphate transporter
MLKELKARGKRGESQFSKAERKGLGKVHKENLVKRALVVRVIAAWIITVPASGLMAAFLYYTIRGFMLP